MSTISRRTFLKLAGVAAVATAGASMLTGCSWFDQVNIVVVVNGKEETSTKMPYIAVQLAANNKEKARKLIEKYGPEEYRNVEFEFDDAYTEALGRTNCKIEKNADGQWEMILAITIVSTTVKYEIIVNKKSIATGETDQFPKGVTKIPEEDALKLAKSKLNYPPYNTVTFEIDKDYPNNLTVVDGKVTIALLGCKG